ncbi:diacylglycerol kinase family protein [Arcanobacterium sp. S3PF19]|uniref:diacylglycerol/lipid kinase family protein n=1 Tax=Arcanobacterium sp. S3PF19 TaxID=1219585 RepID=UPI000689BE31|nr:diacylglycerol kinase family protein [Arcanobacterium sp. S3PF19]
MNLNFLLSLAALVCALCALFLGLRQRNAMTRLARDLRINRGKKTVRRELNGQEDFGPPVVVYNPTKSVDWAQLRSLLRAAARDVSLPEPVWLETTAEDAGREITRKALETYRPEVVIAAGGDGTVRSVAEALAGTEVPLGVFPLGTGNLLARNLNLPLSSKKDMVRTVLTGVTRTIDFAWLEILEPPGPVPPDAEKMAGPGKYGFLVIGGVGFDAEIMSSTNPVLKEKIGWLAYVKGALTNLFSEKMTVRIRPGNAAQEIETEARSVMFMNCGELPGGIVMERNADPANSWLELAVLDVNGGIIGWANLVQKMALKGAGIEPKNLPRGEAFSGDITTHRIRTCEVTLTEPRQVQTDGDVLGKAMRIRAGIDPGALRVRVCH